MKRSAVALTAASLLALAQTPSFAATGEVTLSGSTWTAKVDGTTRYTGNNMSAAVNACVANMSSGTVHVRNSGDKAGKFDISKNNITIDGHGVTVSGGGTMGVVYAQNKSTIGGNLIKMASSDWYGTYFRTCDGQNGWDCNGTANLGARVDNCKGGAGYRYNFGNSWSDSSSSRGSHFRETYGINDVWWYNCTASDRTDGCGVLLNTSTVGNGNRTEAWRCDFGGGYAGFRTANNNRTTTLGTAKSVSCGRGFFSVSGSTGTTVALADIQNCSSHGIWLQTTGSSRVNSGTVKACNPCTSISSDLGGNSINVSCQ